MRRLLPILPLLWLFAFVLLPGLITLRISLSSPATAMPPYLPAIDWGAGIEGWRAFIDALHLSNFETLLSDALYRDAALSSVTLAAGATAILAVIGTPIAHAMARAPMRLQPLLVALVTVPFWTSFLARIYAFQVIARPFDILGTPAAVLIGLTYAYLPFMVLPLYAVMARLDRRLTEAAADLGASPTRVFWTVTLPLARPGLVAGALLCFTPMLGEFIIPDLLGGSDTLMLGRVLWGEFFSNRDWPLASAVAILLLALVIGPIALLSGARREDAPR